MHLCFITSPNFHKMYVWSIHIFWYIDMPDVTSSYGAPFDLILFFWVFSYIIDDHSYLKYCIFAKLSQIVCLTYMFSVFFLWFICFLKLSNIITCLKRYNFIKLLQWQKRRFEQKTYIIFYSNISFIRSYKTSTQCFIQPLFLSYFSVIHDIQSIIFYYPNLTIIFNKYFSNEKLHTISLIKPIK